jgi:hypothetical protein
MVVISNNIIRRKMTVEIPVESNYERVWEQMRLLMSDDSYKIIILILFYVIIFLGICFKINLKITFK